MAGLRPTTHAEWLAASRDAGALTTVPTASTGPAPSAPPTSTAVTVDPAARQADHDQIIVAFQHLAAQDPDGSFPGSSATTRHREAFDKARSGLGLQDKATFRVLEVAFTGEDTARVTFVVDIDQAGGPMSYQFVGGTVREGGRWQVTRSTVVTMLQQTGIALPARAGQTGGVAVVPSGRRRRSRPSGPRTGR